MIFALFVLGVFVGAAVTSAAGDAASTSTFALANGMRVIVLERHSSPLVALALWVRAGAREEEPREIGSAHFLEHTLFKGTTTRRAGDTDIAIENLGAVLDAATGPDYAQFYTTVSALHANEALDILSDVIRNATLPDEEIEHERGVILDELAQHEADPTSHLIDLLYASSYTAHPYARSPAGDAASIRSLTRETLERFYHRCYAPSRCTLVIVGDCRTEQCRAEAVRAFGGWLQASPPTRSAPSAIPGPVDYLTPPSNPESPPSRRRDIRISTPFCMVGIAYPAPAASDLQMASAGMVAAALLGDARSGRLAAEVPARTEAAVRYTPRQDPGLLTATARIPDHDRAATQTAIVSLETNLVKTIGSLQTAPPTQTEFNSARAIVLGRLQFDTETGAGMARALGYAASVGGDPPEALLERIRHLARSDLLKFCRRFLNTEPRVTVRVLPTTDITRGPAD